MHSIISQGKVDAVLASRPADRRALVEEAAGLGKFKRRRHRAELKLNRVRVQVERARDIEEEVRKRLRPLALQATAAERAEKLSVHVAALRARIAELDLAAVEARRAEAEGRKTAAALAVAHARERLEALLAEREQAEEELADVAGTREAATAALYRLRSAGERLGLRREAADGLRRGLQAELAAAREDEDPARRALLEGLAGAAGSAAASARAAEQQVGALDERARRCAGALAGLARATQHEVEAELATLLDGRRALERELAEAAGAREATARARFELDRAGDHVRVRDEALAGFRSALAEDLAEARAREQRGGPSLAELRSAAEDARTAAREATHARDGAAQRVELARERLAALETALAEREGLPPAARALAEAGERLALSLLDVQPGLERAVAAALAWRASALVAADPEAALALLERARAQGLGSLAVVVGGRARPGDAPVAGAVSLPELVPGADAERLLGGVWLVEAERLLAATHGLVITRDGHGYDVDRGELWFAGEAAEAVLLELEARRKTLVAEVDALVATADAALEAAERAEQSAARAEEALAAAPQGERRLASPAVLASLDALAARSAVVLDAAAKRVRALQAARGESANAERGAELGAELARIGELEADLRGRAAEAAARATSFLARFGATETEPGEASVATLEAELVALEEELSTRRAEAAVAAARAREAEQAYAAAAPTAKRQLSSALLVRMCAATERLDEVLLGATQSAGRFEPPLRARADVGAARAGELGAELRRLGAAEVELRGATSSASERAGAVEVELARLDAEAEEARRRRAAVEVESAAGDDRDDLADKLERAERRLEALGRVNPLAKEEYEAEKERLDELAEQRGDLEASLAELDKLHRELTETVETRFAETFARVSANFEEIAATLFPGGEGRLRLTEPSEDDEEAAAAEEPGVEVELRPAGKRITRLSLLSGGEKALGAISFLFALFLAHPCPFYLLDEVEAALDDTNIGRFVDLLRTYSDRAQFVVITHQKRTMEAADILYGVTMAGDGVSQIVSRRLPREESAALATA
jgi:chromosome segregation protein